MKQTKAWYVKVEANGVSLEKVSRKHCHPIFVERAWGIVTYTKENGDTTESLFYGQAGLETRRNKNAITAFHFVENPVYVVEAYIGDTLVPLDNIVRLRFFAQTSRGCLIVSWCPSVGTHSYKLVMTELRDKKATRLAHHLATTWLPEIL